MPSLYSALAQPDVAVLCVLAGILLLYAEFNRPGTIALGAAGMLLAMLGCWGLLQRPVSAAAVGLVGVGVVWLGYTVWRGWRAAGIVVAVVCLDRGLAGLVPPPHRVHPLTAASVAVLWTLVTSLLGTVAMRARRNKRASATATPAARRAG